MIADDVLIVRAGLARLLSDAQIEVVGEAADADGLLGVVAATCPDAALVDIRMPPGHKTEGLEAARRIRAEFPGTAVLVLSEYLAPRYAEQLLADKPSGLGYLLKERVADPSTLTDALERVVRGECVVDPGVVDRLMERRATSPLRDLTPRERQVLTLIAQGRSNAAIASRLGIGERTVESVCAQLFRKLGIDVDPDLNRRVVAVLKVLQPTSQHRGSTDPAKRGGS